MATPHNDGGGCYVNGRSDVVQGVAPSGERAVDGIKCKYCGFSLSHDEGWCDRVCNKCRDEEEQDNADDNDERDYDPDEDRTP